jgi:predicted dehydrogenase
MSAQEAVSRRGLLAAATLTLGAAQPPSDRITLAAIGTGARGRFALSHFLEQKDVRVVAVCDCFAERRQMAKAAVDRHYGNTDCAAYRFHEQVLERKDIDAVLIAGGDRWHAVLSSLAARAGKDVYCEKPFSLTIGEGRALVELTKARKTIWQCGTQRRSNSTWQFVVDLVRSGRIGQLRAITTSFGDGPWRRTGRPEPETPPDPDVFDYDRWLGQAPWAPYSKVRVALWRVNWDTGGGAIADMGAHYFEAAQWARGDQSGGPVEYEGAGVFRRDGGFNNTPYFYNVRARYADGVWLIMDPGPKAVRFDGEEGWIRISDEGAVSAEPKSLLQGVKALESLPAPQGHWNIMAPHIRNFLDSMRSRSLTVSHPEVSHRAHTIIHAANICLRLGRKLRWDPAEEKFDDGEANQMLTRPMRAPWRI